MTSWFLRIWITSLTWCLWSSSTIFYPRIAEIRRQFGLERYYRINLSQCVLFADLLDSIILLSDGNTCSLKQLWTYTQLNTRRRTGLTLVFLLFDVNSIHFICWITSIGEKRKVSKCWLSFCCSWDLFLICLAKCCGRMLLYCYNRWWKFAGKRQ